MSFVAWSRKKRDRCTLNEAGLKNRASRSHIYVWRARVRQDHTTHRNVKRTVYGGPPFEYYGFIIFRFVPDLIIIIFVVTGIILHVAPRSTLPARIRRSPCAGAAPLRSKHFRIIVHSLPFLSARFVCYVRTPRPHLSSQNHRCEAMPMPRRATRMAIQSSYMRPLPISPTSPVWHSR